MKREADLVVLNCKQLLTLSSQQSGPRRGPACAELGIIDDGAMAAYRGTLVAVGTRQEVEHAVDPLPDCEQVDAGGRVVTPGFVDCHTHTVFAKFRVDEYEWRIAGTPYEDIAKRGGGIAKSVADLREMSEERLCAVSRERVRGCVAYGTTTLEIKSGYGLDLENELKQLRVIKTLKDELPLTIVPTFLGAHSVPPEFAGRREEYIELVINEMIPAVASGNLAEYIDVFSEKGVFETAEAERILRAGRAAGLRARLHADELYDTGSAEMAVRVGAASADHLTRMNDKGMGLMAQSPVIAVLLPGTSFGLPSLSFANARQMVDRGVAVAIASDFNPGSSPGESLPMMMSIACSHMRLSPAEAMTAVTYNAACALDRQEQVGSLEPGKRADFLLMAAEDYREIPYRFGINPVERVYVLGRRWGSGSDTGATS